MKQGLLLDNLNNVAAESFLKLQAMRASVVGTLYTAGTHHTRIVYDECERLLAKPLYLLRVGGHWHLPIAWLDDARAALAEVPDQIIIENRIILIAGNEPNLEGWQNNPEGYGRFYGGLGVWSLSVRVAFACPSMGVNGWEHYLKTSLAHAPLPQCIAINVYDYLIAEVPGVIATAGNVPCYVTEVNTLRPGRVPWLQDAFKQLEQNGVLATTIFIAGGRSNGAWDERYIVSLDECRELGQGTPQMIEWTLGFRDYATAHPEVGLPVEGLQYDDHGNAWQHSDTGLLFWHKAKNVTYFFEKSPN